MSFNRKAFRELAVALQGAGYEFRPFEGEPSGRTIYLRHDIDFSTDLALQMAKDEAELGIAATYLFMLTSNTYNLLSVANRKILSEISALGHTVSLHFDPTAYEDMDAGFRAEVSAFAAATGLPVEVVSLHRPGAFLEDNNRRLPDCRHTYEDIWFRETKYISDSGGAFKYGHPLESEAFRNGDPIHLLLHPIWWMTEGDTPSDSVRNWQREHFAFINDEAGDNCLTFDRRSVLEELS